MTKEQFRLEELSTAIDAMNCHCKVLTPDTEVKALIEVAGVIKEYGQSDEENAIIQQLTRDISADLASRRRRKHLVTGCAGVAAAVLLFIGAAVQTPIQPPVQIAQEAGNVRVETNVNNPSSSDMSQLDQVSKGGSSTSTILDSEKAKVAKEDKREQAEEERPLTVATAQRREITPLPQASNQVGNSIVQDTSPHTMLMVLPDRTADLVSSDASGTVRQVYGKNTNEEIILTQRSGTTTLADKAAGVAASLTKSDAPVLNKATRQHKGVEVVIEGTQSKAELERVADSLVPSDQAADVPQPSVKIKQKKE